jgi:predicted Zn-dependent peptidase
VRQLTVQAVDGVRTPHGLGSLIGTVQVILGDPYLFGSDLAKYLKVTPGDVKRVARQYLNPNNRSMVTLIPEKGSKSK